VTWVSRFGILPPLGTLCPEKSELEHCTQTRSKCISAGSSQNENSKRGVAMAESDVVRRAREDAKKGKAPSTQAGEFVREEIEHVREGVHGARSIKQAIAIGLSKARRAGVKLSPPKKGTVSAKVRRQAERDSRKGARRKHARPSRTRSRAVLRALQRESRTSASRSQLSRQAKASARRRGPQARHRSALAAVHTKGRKGLRRAARKAAGK
jgi:hypothetical protein